MPAFDRVLLDPPAAEVAAAMAEAVRQANYRCRVGKLAPDPAQYQQFAAKTMPARPEGVWQCLEGVKDPLKCPPFHRASLLGVAWWSDHLGRRHVRVVGRRVEELNDFHTHRFGPRNELFPPALLTCPARLFLRTLPGREREVVAACSCGVAGTLEALAWMGEECGPCFDRRQEKGGEDPTPQRPLTLQGHRGGVDGVGFAAGGKKLVSVGWGTQGDDWGGTLIVWDVAKGVEKAEQVVDPFMGDLVIPFACNGKHAAVGEYEATRLFDARTGKPTFEGLGGQLDAIALSPDGTTLAYSGGGEIELARPAARATREATFLASSRRTTGPNALAFSPDGGTVAAGAGKAVLLLSVAGGKQRRLSDKRLESVWSVAFTPDGQKLVCGCGPTRTEAAGFGPPDARPRGVFFWDLAAGKIAAELSGHRGTVRAVAVSPDGAAAVSAGNDRTLRFWDLANARPLGTLEWHVGAVHSLAFSPDGETLATGSADGLVRLWPWRELLRA